MTLKKHVENQGRDCFPKEPKLRFSMATPEPISKRELKSSLAVIGLVVAAVILSAFLLATPYWFIWPIIVACMIIAVAYFSASKYYYQCPSCKQAFKITALQDFFAPHGISKGTNGELLEWKLLKCPSCGKREKCYRVKNNEG